MLSLKPERDLREQRPSKDLLAIGVPLAKLIKRKLIPSPSAVMLTQPRSLIAERFRRLKTTIVNRHADKAQVLVITSATPAEGKSTVALNLALAFAAEESCNTLLVDADLRRPVIGAMLKPPPQLGLSDVLSGRASLDHVVLKLDNSRLQILPSGGQAENPSELLASDEASELISDLRRSYERVIVDTPPIVPFTDADAAGAFSDGMILVTRAGVTPSHLVSQALASVTSTKVLGAVLNDAAYSLADWNRYRSYDYDRYYGRDEE